MGSEMCIRDRTITTTMQVNLNRVRSHMQDANLKKSQLIEYLDDSDSLLVLANNSISRAADLINNFKQVAVDQTSEIRREFDLAEVVQSNLETLKIEFKRTPVEFDNVIPEKMLCNSYPGPLGQIVVNLLRNACLHGFDQGQPGQVRISASQHAGLITLQVEDNGRGMDAATLARIFDPFFTTRLGRGGSGLGLSICKRIATNILSGDLVAESKPEQGSSFTVKFPADAPGKHLMEDKQLTFRSPH